MTDGENIEVVRNYQVFRGLSPNTATRLEARLRELEDALEQERQARLRAESELNDMSFELTSVTERLEEAEGAGGAQSEYNRKRDAEFMKLKKDFDHLGAQHEAEMAALRKRHQDALNELADQIDHLNKQKARLEKEKQQLLFEIESSNSALDAANKARALAEGKVEHLEDQLRRLKAQVEELSRQNNDLSAWKAKLTQENYDLHRQVQELDSALGNMSKAKALLQATVDDLKSQLDDALSAKNSLSMAVNSLQIELDNANARYEEEAELCSSLKAQLHKALNDLASLKAKYDQDINIRIGEYEEARRKAAARISELEDLLEQWKTKAHKLEKDKVRLTIEIRDLAAELEAANMGGGDLAKRLKHSDTLLFELQKKYEDLSGHAGSNAAELLRLQAENARLKAALQDAQDKLEAALRENKKLSDALRDAHHQIKDLTRQVHDLLAIKAQLEAERDRLALELADAHDTIKDLHARLDASNAALNQLKIDFEHRLRERDEELDAARKAGQRGVEELQKTIIDIETKYKNELSRQKKKYDTDMHELEIQLESLSRSNSELVKANKSLAIRIKELEMALEAERAAGDEARNALTISERKRIALQTELEDLRALLEAAERARKAAEAALGDNTGRLNELSMSLTAISNEKKRLEGDLASLAAALDDAMNGRRAAEERADKLQLEVNRLATELARALDNFAQADALRKALENELRELTLRLEEAENYAQREGKRLVAKLQGRIRELEAELEAEQRRGRDLISENKKLVKQLHELRLQADEDHRLVAELTEQINSMQSKIALYKRQLLEADEVINITLAKYRKAQQQLEECERRAETAEKNITVRINRGSSAVHGAVSHHHSMLPSNRARSMSVTRETHRVFRA